MRTMVRITTVTAVMAGALSLGTAWGAGPPAADRGPELCFELADGSVITGRLDAKTITIRIASGDVLKVPVADLKELTAGVKDRPGIVQRAKPQSKIKAGETTLLGTVTVRQFRIASSYGRFTVKLDDIRRIRRHVKTPPNIFRLWTIELRDKTRLKGVAITQSLGVQTRYGKMIVPIARIREATFDSDGKSIRVQCWGTERVVGAIDSRTTLSFRTDKGKADLSPGKIGLMSQRPITLKGRIRTVLAVAFSPDGKRLVSAGHSRSINLWDAVTGKELLTIKKRSSRVEVVAFSPDGKRLHAGSGVWDSITGKKVLTLSGESSGWVRAIVFSPDGKRLLLGRSNSNIQHWDAAGRELFTIKNYFGHALAVAFSSDAKRFASAPGRDGNITIFDTAAAKKLLALKGLSKTVYAIAFSPDGKRLAAGGLDKSIKLWDTTTGKELLTLGGHSDYVRAVAFSPDGKRLASGSKDGTIKFWDTVTGKELATLKEHSTTVTSIAFSPDGKRLASGSEKTIKIWDLPDWTKAEK